MKKDTILGYCGLDCGACPIHLATLQEDPTEKQKMRLEIANICSHQYGMDLQPQDITDCDGCTSHTGRLFQGCLKCEIRKCAVGRKLTSCASCSDFACGHLLKRFEAEPDARSRLEAIRDCL